MAKYYRWERREKRRQAKRARMPKHGRSLFLLERITEQKALSASKKPDDK